MTEITYSVGDLEATNGVGDVGKDLERRHHFVVGVFVVEGDVFRLVEGVEQELVPAVLCAGNASLILQFGGPDSLFLFLLPRRGFLRDGGIIFGKGGFFLVE